MKRCSYRYWKLLSSVYKQRKLWQFGRNVFVLQRPERPERSCSVSQRSGGSCQVMLQLNEYEEVEKDLEKKSKNT